MAGIEAENNESEVKIVKSVVVIFTENIKWSYSALLCVDVLKVA